MDVEDAPVEGADPDPVCLALPSGGQHSALQRWYFGV